MQRREMLTTLGALAVSAAVTETATAKTTRPGNAGKFAIPARLTDDAFFLSATNPTANVDQRDLEALSIRVMNMPLVVKTRAAIAQRWKTTVGKDISPEAWGARFDEMIEGYTFNCVMQAVNSDANYPKVFGHWEGPPHEWFGIKVPDSRAGGGDNPDNNYSIFPVDGRAHFELHGRRFSPGTADIPFTVQNYTLATLGSLDWQDVVVNADGSFVITLDPEPANGRPNHIQTRIGATQVLIRDSRADWRQIPNAYRIRRLDHPAVPPLTPDQMADRAAELMMSEVPMYFWLMRTFANLPLNVISKPIEMGGIGGLVSQQGSWARLHLADDEAFVVTTGTGGAAFRNLVLQDSWFRTLDYWTRTSNMCSAQAIPNADGSVTYVISIRDPGIHNWLDSGGLHDLLVLHRWQGISRKPTTEGTPWVKGELVKLDDLDKVLPPDTKRVTAEGRAQQLAERLAEFKLRHVDH